MGASYRSKMAGGLRNGTGDEQRDVQTNGVLQVNTQLYLASDHNGLLSSEWKDCLSG